MLKIKTLANKWKKIPRKHEIQKNQWWKLSKTNRKVKATHVINRDNRFMRTKNNSRKRKDKRVWRWIRGCQSREVQSQRCRRREWKETRQVWLGNRECLWLGLHNEWRIAWIEHQRTVSRSAANDLVLSTLEEEEEEEEDKKSLVSPTTLSLVWVGSRKELRVGFRLFLSRFWISLFR